MKQSYLLWIKVTLVLSFLVSSIAVHFILGSPPLFDLNGFNEQHLLGIGCFLDLLGFFSWWFELERLRILCLFCFAVWSCACPLFIIQHGHFQSNVAFIPFYVYWILHFLWCSCIIFGARRASGEDDIV